VPWSRHTTSDWYPAVWSGWHHEDPWLHLGFPVEFPIAQARRVDQLRQRVLGASRALQLDALREDAEPVSSGLPLRWSKCKWQLTTSSTSSKRASAAASAANQKRRRGQL
jgi:hypothetical protein